jgi:hypothetical protein
VEAEYISANEGLREVVWLRSLLTELGFQQQQSVLHEDNQGCIANMKNNLINDRSKHVDIKYHWIRKEFIENQSFRVMYCKTNDMIADVLTKSVGNPAFDKHRFNMGIVNIKRALQDDFHSRGSVISMVLSSRKVKEVEEGEDTNFDGISDGQYK